VQRSFGIDRAASHGLAAAQDLGDDVLLDLIRSDDPVGMLSIYVDGAAAAAYGGARSNIGNRLVELERSVIAEGSPLVAGGSAGRSGGSRRSWSASSIRPRRSGRRAAGMG
jgi:hypothetical protein